MPDRIDFADFERALRKGRMAVTETETPDDERLTGWEKFILLWCAALTLAWTAALFYGCIHLAVWIGQHR
jgi:hypothetical protein